VECGTETLVEFGNQRECTGCLKICKYEDKNDNGQKDRGESYLSGWEFTITNDSGYSKTVTTGGSGGPCGSCDYCVTVCDLIPGDYTITETLKDGWTCTTDNPLTVKVECDKTTNVDFGNRGPCTGCLKIYKYNDKNGDGNWTQSWPYYESYLSGWVFTVTDIAGHSWTGTTNYYGYVTICDLAPGEYTITETLKDGWTCTTGNPRTVKVECDKTTRVDFGNQQECTGCLKIYKYNDENGNGIQGGWCERYLANWEFTVTDAAGNSWSGTTNRYGYVTICNLPIGDYTITETPKAGWTNTDPADGSGTKTDTVSCGTTTTVKFGNMQKRC
jgi:hypothetical protein